MLGAVQFECDIKESFVVSYIAGVVATEANFIGSILIMENKKKIAP